MPEPPADPPNEPVTRPDHHGLGVHHPQEDAKPRKRGPLRWMIRLVVVLVLLVGLLVALAPKLLSTDFGKRWVVSILSERVDATIEIESLDLRWGKGQRVTGLTYKNPREGTAVSIAELDASELGLFDVLTGSRRLGSVRLVDVEVVYTQPEQRTDDARAVEPVIDRDAQPLSLPPSLSGELAIDGLLVRYESAELEPVVLTMPAGRIAMPNLREIEIDLDATVRQGEKNGRLVLEGAVLNLFDPEGWLQQMKAGYDVSAMVQDVPIAAVEQVLGRLGRDVYLFKSGRLVALLGEGEVDAKATVKGTVDELASDLTVVTPNLRVALVQAREGDTLIADPQSSARLNLTPEGFKALFPETDYELLEPSGIALKTFEMRLPTTNDGIDWTKATAAVLFQGDANLAIRDPAGQVLGIDALRVGGVSTSIAEQIEFKASTTLSDVSADAAARTTREAVGFDVVVRSPLSAEREIDFFSEKLPIQLADRLLNQQGRLVLWLGELFAMRAELRGNITQDAQGSPRLVQTYTLWPEGRITGEIIGTIEPDRYTLATKDKRPVEAVLVPEAFASLMELVTGKPGEPALTIDRPMPVYITVRDEQRGEVAITTDPSKTGIERLYPDPDRTYLGLSIELSPATVYDPKREATYQLRGGTLSLSAPDLRGRAEVRADLRLAVRPDAGQQGVSSLLTWQTTVTDLLNNEGALPLDGQTLMQQIALDGGVELENVPSGLFDSLLNRDGDIASVLGPIVQQMQADFTYAGGQPTAANLKLNWDDANNQPITGAWASMKPAAFDIDADQMLTVRGGEDLELEVRVSEAFGDRWMGKLHPILFDAKSGDEPVRITIDGGSFKFPMNDPSMQGAVVNAEVDLGAIEFGDQALLGRIMSWTDRPGERAVFAPTQVKLADGKISYDGFGLAVGNVRLRLDGEVDLVEGEIVDMAVRVPGESLIRVFNELDGIIPKDDYLNIPMTGLIRQPEFDQQLITREVSRLLTRGLIDNNRDKLKDKVREELGIDEGEPGSDVIDNALDLLFGRGQRNRQPDQEGE